MSRDPISVENAARAWSEGPAYRATYDALEGEFARAPAMTEARAAAGMTQRRVAEAMSTTQAISATIKSRSRRS